MWLEIEGDVILGVHSDRCENQHQWIEYSGDAKPGDRWHKNKVIPQNQTQDSKTKKRHAARAKIISIYPEWKQMNILREGNDEHIAMMGKFIDACRYWSNQSNSQFSELEKITP